MVKVEGNIEKLSESCRKGGDYLYLKASCFPPVKSPDCLAKGVKVVAATMSSRENFVYTACPGLGDHENCTLKTYVKDGRIIRTEKLVYPPPEGDHAVICQKGLAAGRLPYLPGRLKKPLKRVGERGSGKFQEISWDQAMDEIGTKLVEIKDRYGPQAFAIWQYLSSYPPNAGLHFLLGERFRSTFGATDPVQGLGLDTGPFFASYFDFGHSMAYQFSDARRLVDSKYIIIWGTNPAELCHRSMRWIIEARERGAKVVDIGLIYDVTAAKSDWFIPVAAGSDTALALAMANVIITERLHDQQFLIKNTVAPLLVRQDNGKFLREFDVVPGGDASNYMVWDQNTRQAQKVPPQTLDLGNTKPALTGTYNVGGIMCKPAFQKLLDHLTPLTPEAQQAVTGVAPETVRQLAREYATSKPAAICFVLGLRYHNAPNAYRAMNLLAALTGNIGLDGGGSFCPLGFGGSTAIAYNDIEIMFPDGLENSKISYIRNYEFYDAVRSGTPYPIKALFITGNVLHSWANRQRWVEEIFPKLDLVFTYDIFLTETGEFCDYVLPDCTSFERKEIISPGFNWIILQEPAIEPIGEAKPPTYFWSELAKRVGLGHYFDKTTEEWLAMRLNSSDPTIAGIDPPLTWERLTKEKMVRANVPERAPDLAALGQFLTDSGRIEFYTEHLAETGEAIARHREQLESPRGPKAARYPLQFFNGRKRFFMQSIFGNDPLMIKLNGGEPSVRLNPDDADALGIKDGDLIEVYNDRGNLKAKVSLSAAVPPGVCHVWFGWWKNQFPEGTYQNLILPISSAEVADPSCDRWADIALERSGFAPMFMSETFVAGRPDILWDCLVAVRKA